MTPLRMTPPTDDLALVLEAAEKQIALPDFWVCGKCGFNAFSLTEHKGCNYDPLNTSASSKALARLVKALLEIYVARLISECCPIRRRR